MPPMRANTHDVNANGERFCNLSAAVAVPIAQKNAATYGGEVRSRAVVLFSKPNPSINVGKNCATSVDVVQMSCDP